MHTDLNRLAPVLYIGIPGSPVLRRLRELGLRVVVVDRPERGLRLLRQFVVSGVVYDAPTLPPVLELVALGAPVVLLGCGITDWGGPQVKVLGRDAPATEIAQALGSLQRDAAAAS